MLQTLLPTESSGFRLAAGRSRVATVVVFAVAVSVVAGGLIPFVVAGESGTVEGSPDLEVTAPEAWFDPGEDATLELFVENDGTVDDDDTHPEEAIDRATEARATSVEVTDADGAPLEVRTGEQSVGLIEDGETVGPVPFDVLVEDDAEEGTYEIEVTIEYTDAHTVEYEYDQFENLQFSEETENVTETYTVEVEILGEAHFAVTDLEHDAAVGDEGDLEIEMENVGDENATDAVVTAIAQDQDVFFGAGGSSSETFVGEWDEDAAVDLEFRAGFADEAAERPYPVELLVEYEDEDGEAQDETVLASLTPEPRQSFDVRMIRHDVRIDDQGRLRLAIENEGPSDAYDATVEVESQDAAVQFNPDGPGTATAESFVGNISAGETERTRFRMGTTSDAIHTDYPLDVTVTYEDEDGNEMTSRTTTIDFFPQPEQQFSVASVSHDVSLEDDGTLELEIQNWGPGEVRDAVVTAEALDGAIEFDPTGPGSPTSEAVLGDLQVDDEGTVSYRVGTTEDAIRKPYPIELTIEYEDSLGEERTPQTLLVEFEPDGKQEFSVVRTDHDLSIDEQGLLSLQLRNEGPHDAHEATVEVESQDAAIQFNPDGGGTPTAAAGVGEWGAGTTTNVAYRIGATSDAIETTYPIDVTVVYEDDDGNEMTARTRQIEVEPEARHEFAVESLDHTVAIDDDGILELELQNRGPHDAHEATVEVESQDTAIQIGSATEEPLTAGDVVIDPDDVGAVASEAYVGEWEEDENATVRFVAAATDDAIEKAYPLDVTVAYEDDEGNEMTPRTLGVGFEPFAEQSFAIEAVESDLRVGQDGDLEGELVNTGDRTVDSVVLQYDSEIDNVAPRERGYAIGTLDPGESAPASFRLGVTDDAEPGPRVVEFVVRYRNPQGDIRVSDTIDVVAEIDERRDRFDARVANSTLTAGEREIVEFEIQNRDDETLSNVRMKLFTSSPLDSGDTEAFIPRLEPGETTTVAFELEADSGAVPRTYPVSMDFRFDDERNETQMSRTQNVPVEVVPPEDEELPSWLWILVGLAVLAAALLAAFRYGLFPDGDGGGGPENE